MIKTEAGEKMKEENPVDGIKTIDGQELLRQELEKQDKKFETPEMNMGGLMCGGMGVTIGIEEESGNEIPAGSMPQEVADDIPAMLSEGEYVIPADVVRWHGVKQFEMMRQEAKMGMGLMAEDGRIAEVESEEYEIEEKDKPEVEKATVKVVEAAEGIITMPEAPDPVVPARYRLTQEIDPQTGRIVYVYRDPVTGETVTPEEFKPELSTRMSPAEIIQREVYGKGLGEEEEPIVEDDTTPVPVPTYEDSDGDGPQYTEVNRTLGNQFGYTGPSIDPVLATLGGPIGGVVKFAQNVNNAAAVSAARKSLGLGGLSFLDQLGAGFSGEYSEGLVGGIKIGDEDYDVSLGISKEGGGAAGGGVYDVTTGKRLTSPEEIEAAGRNARTTLTVSEAQRRQQMAEQGADFPEDPPKDPFDVDYGTAFEDMETTGGSFTQPDSYRQGSPRRSPYSAEFDMAIVSGQTPSTAVDRRGSNAYSDESDNDSPSGTDSGSSAATASDNDTSDYSGYMNKGGYVTKKNKPKMATMQYSKGSK